MQRLLFWRNAVGILSALVLCFAFSSCKDASPTQPTDQDDTATMATGIDSFEVDDLPAQAGSLNLHPAQVHSLKDSMDVDWMKLSVDAGEVVSFMVTSKCIVG
jgi:hypothetical protein